MNERRRHKRYSVSWPARLLLSDKTIHSAHIKDISAGGLLLETSQALSLGTEVGVEFFLPTTGDNNRVRAYIKVCFVNILSDSRGAALGFEFSRISRENMHALSNLLQALEQAGGNEG